MSVGSAVPPRPATIDPSATTDVAARRLPAAFLLAFGVALGLPAANGGYFPTSWGWSGLALVLVAAVALLVRGRSAFGRWELVLVAAWTAFVGWTWLSASWSREVGSSILEGERALVVLTGIVALLCVRRRGDLAQIAGGLLTGMTAIAAFALATRLFPSGEVDVVALNRLARPVGYWNALGLYCVVGALLAAGLAAHGRHWTTRALASAALPIVVTTLYFTYSRGAWLALGFGLLAAVAAERRRAWFVTSALLCAVAPAIALLLASRSHALTHVTAPLAARRHDGHRLAVDVIVLALAGGALAAIAAGVQRSTPSPSRVFVRAYGALLAAVVVAAVVGALVHYGGPVDAAKRGYHSFLAPAPSHQGGNLNRRLFSFSSNGRVDLWRVAWRDAQEHPVLGSGAGTYEQSWLRDRPRGQGKARDAHGLYIETLAELGPPGLALLVAALALPLLAAFRARRRRLAPAVLGAYVAFVLHAGVDWDWEVTGVALSALLCGAALVTAADDRHERREVGAVARGGAVAGAVALAALLFVVLVGNLALADSADAVRAGKWKTAAADARRASGWAPWSSDALQALGDAQLGAGDAAAARATLRKAVAKAPDDWSIWFDLARASTGRARHLALARAAALNPLSPEVAEFRRELRIEETPIDVVPGQKVK